MTTPRWFHLSTPDLGLLFLRVAGAILLLHVHGIPKILHFQSELQKIEDPLHLGHGPTLVLAIFAEVVCPIFNLLGFRARLASFPIVFLLLVSMILVHPEWTIAEGQFGWLLFIVFGTIGLAGLGRHSLDAKRSTPA